MSSRSLGDIPDLHQYSATFGPHLAATATELLAVIRIPFDARIRSSHIVPLAAATGDNTNRTNYNILNGGTAGTGTTEIGNFDPVTGADLAVGVEKDIPIATAPLAVTEGTKLFLQAEKVASGLAVGGGTWVVLIDGVN
jgi:hypothetical protein